ncbi:MAG: hypothetical protein GXY03_02500 [Solirubrobacterales bacterium]|nr:hypothetical protein [Solirubrobacterales bacterium]
MGTVRLSREQRDAIYGEILVDLTAVGDIYLKLSEGDIDGAWRVRQRVEDDMRLLDDLGWEAEVDQEVFEVSMPAAQLARAVAHLAECAQSTVREHVIDPMQQTDLVVRATTAQTAYGQLLSQAVREVDDSR